MNEFNTEIMVQCPFCGYAMITPNKDRKYLWCSHCQLICPESEDGTPSGAYAAFDKLIDRIRNYNPENYPTPTEEEKKFFWMRSTCGDDMVARTRLSMKHVRT